MHGTDWFYICPDVYQSTHRISGHVAITYKASSSRYNSALRKGASWNSTFWARDCFRMEFSGMRNGGFMSWEDRLVHLSFKGEGERGVLFWKGMVFCFALYDMVDR